MQQQVVRTQQLVEQDCQSQDADHVEAMVTPRALDLAVLLTPPSIGSALHSLGKCRPCAWFWKPGSCQNGQTCMHCHLCPEGALKARKKERRVAVAAHVRQRERERTGQHILPPSGDATAKAEPRLPPFVPAHVPATFPLKLEPNHSKVPFCVWAAGEKERGPRSSAGPVEDRESCHSDCSTMDADSMDAASLTRRQVELGLSDASSDQLAHAPPAAGASPHAGPDSIASYMPGHVLKQVVHAKHDPADRGPGHPGLMRCGSPACPSVGSAPHHLGLCKPCNFVHRNRCSSGAACKFCHLCGPEECQRRKKEKQAMMRVMKRGC